jgi:hypothetical protein
MNKTESPYEELEKEPDYDFISYVIRNRSVADSNTMRIQWEPPCKTGGSYRQQENL